MKLISKNPRFLQTDSVDLAPTCRAALELRVSFHMWVFAGIVAAVSISTRYNLLQK